MAKAWSVDVTEIEAAEKAHERVSPWFRAAGAGGDRLHDGSALRLPRFAAERCDKRALQSCAVVFPGCDKAFGGLAGLLVDERMIHHEQRLRSDGARVAAAGGGVDVGEVKNLEQL